MHRKMSALFLLLATCLTLLTEAGAIVCHQCAVEGLGPIEDCSDLCTVGGSVGCFSEIALFDGDFSRRWGCIPAGASPAVYCQPAINPLIAYNISCCDTDYCNLELYPSLPSNPPATTTHAPTPTNPSTVPAQPSEPMATTNPATSTITPATPSSNNISTESPTTLPTTQATATATSPLPMSGRTCHRSMPDSAEWIVCPLQTTCFVSVRRRSDNSLTYRRGCTPRSSTCVPEDRNRKIKICCNTSQCNAEFPTFGKAPELIPNHSNNSSRYNHNSTGNGTDPIETTPDLSASTPTHSGPTSPDISTTTHSGSTSPDISTTGPTSSDDPNAPDIDVTDAPSESTTLPVDQSTPANTMETVTMTSEPIPPEIPPATDVHNIHCVCDSCLGGYCKSTMGCATVHNRVADSEQVTRMCVLTPTICTNSYSENFRVVCCKGELCNHVNTTETTPTTADMGETEESSSSSKKLSIYYVLTIVMSVIFITIAAILLTICICTYQHHRRKMDELRKQHDQRHRTATSATKTPA